ncbi:MAG: hypothetical protein E7458_05890 [Ruminococcaceae bacterium]|nr:hypothetical protein [Oscillospiraceae bacterium]
MKKRIVSLLLALCMVLAMFPAVAYAEGESAATDVLKLHMMCSNPNEEWEAELTDVECQVFGGMEMWAVLHHADGSTETISPELLEFPSFAKLEHVDQKTGRFDLHMNALGDGQICYTVGDTTYTVGLHSTVPDLGLYSAVPYTADGIFDGSSLMEEVTLREDSKTFYIALSPEVAGSTRMQTVHETFGDEIRHASVTTIGNVVLDSEGRYATVTITDPTAQEAYHFEAELENRNDQESGDIRGRTVWIENDMPRLYMCFINQNRDEVTVNREYPASDWSPVPGDIWRVCFYYAARSEIRAGEAQPLSPAQLEFPAWVTAELWEEENDLVIPENAIELKVTRFAAATDAAGISYRLPDDDVSLLSAKTVLPDVGFYSAPTPSEETYLYTGHPFVQTEENDTFYVCLRNTVSFRNLTFEKWANEEYAALFEVTPANANMPYLTVQVKESKVVPTSEIGMKVCYERLDHNRWEEDDRHIWMDTESTIPTLMYRWLRWDEKTETYYEDESERLGSQLWMQSGNSTVLQFYFGTSQNMTPVALSDLTLPEDLVSIKRWNDADHLCADAYEGKGVISYVDPDTQNVLGQMEVVIEKPEFGLYRADTATEANYLDDEVMLSDTDDVFYVLAGGKQTIRSIRVLSNWQEDVSGQFDITLASDGEAAKLQMKQGNFPMGGRYQIEITTQNDGRYRFDFRLIRGDLPQLSTPYELTWHREYYWGDETDVSYEERMGSMSFRFGELRQNRIAVEIYRVENGKDVLVHEGGWSFGDTNHSSYFSISDFIYEQFESGTYRFRIKAEADGVEYRDSEWSELSGTFTYTKPTEKLAAPDAATFRWEKRDGRYMAYWQVPTQEGQDRYEIRWIHEEQETGKLVDDAGNFDGNLWNEDGYHYEPIQDEVLERHGNTKYYFKVRLVPKDITKYQLSEFSALSPALDTRSITDQVNEKLDELLTPVPDQSGSAPQLTLDQVQEALKDSTAELRTAMTADQSISGGVDSGTLEKIRELEKEVADNVDQKVEVHDKANKEIAAIAGDIEMVGAALNWEDAHPESGKTPTVTLVVDEPKKGIVIPEQQHNAIQFSLKLKGAVNYVEEEESGNNGNQQEDAGQKLFVPIVIDIPVPASINPDFLVILHLLSDKKTVEQIRPNIYYEETESRYRATFVIDSFSDFAMLEYDFQFEQSSVSKTVGDADFTVLVTGAPQGSTVTYESNDPTVATVDGTGKVTILAAGETVITATASAYDIYPEATASYTLTVEAQEELPPAPPAPRPPVIVVTPPTAAPVPDEEPESGDPSASAPEQDPAPKPVENPFSDIPEDAYYQDAVLWAVENGITAGVGDGTRFDPDAPCTRAQMAVFLWRAAGCPEPESDAAVFADVELDAYYTKAVQWAVENGITLGTSDTGYSPDAPCTRAQMAAFLYRFEQSRGGGFTGAWMFRLPFTDVPEWAYEAIAWCYMNGITSGTAEDAFSPDAPCTRAQLAAFLYRLLGE